MLFRFQCFSSLLTLPHLPFPDCRPCPACYPCRFASISPAFSLSPCWYLFVHQPAAIISQLCSNFNCQLFQCPGLCHIYLLTSVTSVQAVVILAAHHLIPPELPAPTMSSSSSLLCCPLGPLLSLFDTLADSQCFCWRILLIVLVRCFVNFPPHPLCPFFCVASHRSSAIFG